MNTDVATHLAVQALMLALKISLPLLMTALLVGLLVSIFQAATQIQEATLTFIPKLLAMGAVLVLAGPWMLDQALAYTRDLYLAIPDLVGR